MEKKTTIKERVQAIEHALFGNGSIGIVEQVKNIRKIQWVILFMLIVELGEKIIKYLEVLIK